MVTETMTITAALVELKTLSARIDRAIDANFVGVFIPKNAPINQVAMASEYTGNYARARDLMARRDAIKRAIIISNANTTIDLQDLPEKGDGSKYTVAEIIELRKSGIEPMVKLRNQLTRVAAGAMRGFENAKNEIERTARDFRSSTPSVATADSSANPVEDIYEMYITKNAPTLVDPLSIMKLIDQLQIEIDTIESKTDVALSISNANTVITVRYGTKDADKDSE